MLFKVLKILAFLFLVFILPIACGTGFGDGQGAISGRVCLDYDDKDNCDNSYDLDPSIYTIEKIGERTIIEIWSNDLQGLDADFLMFYIYDDSEVAKNVYSDIKFSSTGLIRPQIHLMKTFGGGHYPLDVNYDSSWIRFTQFGVEEGDYVEAKFHLDLVGKEHGEARGELDGWYKFRVNLPFLGNNQEYKGY